MRVRPGPVAALATTRPSSSTWTRVAQAAGRSSPLNPACTTSTWLIRRGGAVVLSHWPGPPPGDQAVAGSPSRARDARSDGASKARDEDSATIRPRYPATRSSSGSGSSGPTRTRAPARNDRWSGRRKSRSSLRSSSSSAVPGRPAARVIKTSSGVRASAARAGSSRSAARSASRVGIRATALSRTPATSTSARPTRLNNPRPAKGIQPPRPADGSRTPPRSTVAGPAGGNFACTCRPPARTVTPSSETVPSAAWCTTTLPSRRAVGRVRVSRRRAPTGSRRTPGGTRVAVDRVRRGGRGHRAEAPTRSVRRRPPVVSGRSGRAGRAPGSGPGRRRPAAAGRAVGEPARHRSAAGWCRSARPRLRQHPGQLAGQVGEVAEGVRRRQPGRGQRGSAQPSPSTSTVAAAASARVTARAPPTAYRCSGGSAASSADSGGTVGEAVFCPGPPNAPACSRPGSASSCACTCPAGRRRSAPRRRHCAAAGRRPRGSGPPRTARRAAAALLQRAVQRGEQVGGRRRGHRDHRAHQRRAVQHRGGQVVRPVLAPPVRRLHLPGTNQTRWSAGPASRSAAACCQ